MGEKMLKIGEFAARFGISDRHARRLFAQTEADIVGHFEKRGAAGTFIDDVAVEILRNKLTNPVEILPAEAFDSTDDLRAEITELRKQLMLKDEQLNLKNERLAELALKVADASSMPALLEAARTEKQALQEKNDDLLAQNGSLSAQTASLSIENERLMEMLERAEKRAEDVFSAYNDANKEFKIEETRMQNVIDSQSRIIADLENRTLIDYVKSLFARKDT